MSAIIPLNLLTLNFHSDPGHGWLEVPKPIVRDLGNEVVNAISPYSYQDSNCYYLEEDCDASLVLQALKNQGFEVKFNEIEHNNSAPCKRFKRVENFSENFR